MAEIKNVPQNHRALFGQTVNSFKKELNEIIDKKLDPFQRKKN